MVTARAASPAPWKAAVFLLRHGETGFNVRYRPQADPLDFDSRLTERGWEQATRASGRVAELAPDLIVTSPLTRALQTAEIVSRNVIPVRVEVVLRERLYNSCDIGRPASVLAAEFPHWRFRHLAEQWWYQDPAALADDRGIVIEPEPVFLARIADFRRWLVQYSQRRLIVVGHATFFHYLCGMELENAELLKFPHYHRQEMAVAVSCDEEREPRCTG